VQNLRIPGPTPCPPETLNELSRQMINHRGPEFADMQARLLDRLKLFFRTSKDVYVLTASGTGAMEAAIVNVLSEGDKVLAVSIGEFGDRFAEIAQAYRANVIRLNFEPGSQADSQAIANSLAADPEIVAVLLTHNETSTGVTNDLAAISKALRAVK
jgi:aspartate aminotransferase-like enzyme